MAHQLQATPDQALAAIGGVLGGVAVAACVVWRLGAPTRRLRRQRRRAARRDDRQLRSSGTAPWGRL